MDKQFNRSFRDSDMFTMSSALPIPINIRVVLFVLQSESSFPVRIKCFWPQALIILLLRS